MCALVTGVQTCALPIFSRGNMDFSAPQTSADCLRADGTLNPAKLDQHLGANVTAFTNADGQRRFSYDINRYNWTDWRQNTTIRSAERRVGHGRVSTDRSRW